LTLSIPKNSVSLDEKRDGALLIVTVHNALPCVSFRTSFYVLMLSNIILGYQPIDIDEVAVTLTGREGDRLLFISDAQSLVPGSNKLELFCPVGYTIACSIIEIIDIHSLLL
jgi:hypothetical protein